MLVSNCPGLSYLILSRVCRSTFSLAVRSHFVSTVGIMQSTGKIQPITLWKEKNADTIYQVSLEWFLPFFFSSEADGRFGSSRQAVDSAVLTGSACSEDGCNPVSAYIQYESKCRTVRDGCAQVVEKAVDDGDGLTCWKAGLSKRSAMVVSCFNHGKRQGVMLPSCYLER
jgi:hypothetical protein